MLSCQKIMVVNLSLRIVAFAELNCSEHVTWHTPIGAWGKRECDFRAIRDTVSFVLRSREPMEELCQRVGNNFVGIRVSKGNLRQLQKLMGGCSVCHIVEKEEIVQFVRTEARLRVVLGKARLCTIPTILPP